MGLRKRYLPFAALLGAALGVVPALATSGTAATISAAEGSSCSYYLYCWSPSQATIGEGASVAFQNPSMSVPHGVVWHSIPAGASSPSCEASVPVHATVNGEGKTNWKGNCAFSQTGTYVFYCSVHGSEMTGSITVNANGTTTTTTGTTTGTTTTTTTTPPPPPPPPPTTTTSTTPPPTSTTTPSAVTTTPPPASTPAVTTPTANGEEAVLSPLVAGSLKLTAPRRGFSVRGSLKVARSGAGGRLEVDLLASSASLARRGHRPKQTLVGRLIRSSLSAGRVSFSVALNARGRRALRRHHKLSLTVRIVIAPPHGSAQRIARSIVLHA